MNLIISHGDGDGICASAVAYRYLKNANICFAQPFSFKFLLNKLYKEGELSNYNQLLILDIAYSKNVLKYLKKFKKKYGMVIYIDHHPQSLKIKDIFGGIIDVGHSTTYLVAKYFCVDDKKLITLGEASDKLITLSQNDVLFNEVVLLNKSITCDVNDDIFRIFLIKKLAEGKMPSELNEVIEKAKECDKKNEEAFKNIHDKIVYENDKIVIINVSDIEKNIYSGRVGLITSKLAIEKKKIAFFVFKNGDETVITARKHNEINVNLGEIMKKYFNGGGHENAGSGHVKWSVNKTIAKIIEIMNGAGGIPANRMDGAVKFHPKKWR